jgi:iron complex outermembrane recepter protein
MGVRMLPGMAAALGLVLLSTATALAAPETQDPQNTQDAQPAAAQDTTPEAQGTAADAQGTPPPAAPQDTSTGEAQPPLATIPVKGDEPAAPPATVTRLEDVMVTSQKRVQSIQDVPISVTALTGQMLYEQAVTDVREALQLTPNARVDAAGFFSAPRIRGFTLNNNNKSFEPPVGMVFDGIPHARIEYFLAALMDTQRMEVMRGPQGTTFGKNTTAGLIHLISNEPTSTAQGYLQFDGGELGRRHLEAAYGGPVTDGFNFRIAGLLDQRDGFIENTTATVVDSAPKELKDRKRTGMRLTTEAPDLWGSRLILGFEASEMYDGGTGLETILSGPNFQDAVRNYDPRADFVPGNWIASIDEPDYKDVSIKRGRFQLDRSIGDWEFVALGAHADMRQTLSIDTDFTPAPCIPGSGTDHSPETYGEFRFTAPTLGGLAGLTLLPGSSELLFGVSGGHRKILDSHFIFGVNNRPFAELVGAAGADTGHPPDPTSTGGLVGAPASDVDNYDELDQSFEQDAQELSGFAHLQYAFHPKWKIELGGRYTTEKKDGLWNLVFTTPPPNTTLKAIGTEEFTATRALDMKNFQPKVSLGFTPWADLSTFVHWEKGYKAGGFNAFALREGTCSQLAGGADDPSDSDCQGFRDDDLVFRDEVATNIGFDVKTWLFSHSMNLNLSLFREEAKDFQVLIRENPSGTIGLGTSRVVNAEEALAQGVEADLRWLALDWLNIMAAIGVLQTEFVKFTKGECPVGNSKKDSDKDGDAACAQTGKSFPFAPELGVTVSARVTLPLTGLPAVGNSLGGLAFVGGILAEYEDTQVLDVDLDERKRQPAYTRYRADIGVSSMANRWTVRFVGENLTDTETWVRMGDVFEDVVVGSQNQPRLMYLQFRQDF